MRQYLITVVGVATLSAACWLLTPLTRHEAIALIYLLVVLHAGMALNRGPALLVATLSALC